MNGGVEEVSMEGKGGVGGAVRDGEMGTATEAAPAAAVSLEALRKRMADFARERDWEQFHSPRNLLLALVGEVGELSEIFQWKGEVPKGLTGWDEDEKEHLGEELSDVLLYLVRLSDMCGVDLGKAALRKMEINARKYPVGQCKGSSKKHTHYGFTNSVASANDNVNTMNKEHNNGA
ncbi:dCTP pyrophosphatase 1 [Panicum miliaceum]|uniref:dCTP pyrophosphatase 1 n=1 Tax=Panicum miliaceum TaxID=4540 RepID=A0A3L6RS04_PANMI|nr:dCTP pyrophosphatase 1 [Panicum miliaceum]